jgi:parallel beta-helix repeat protein
VILEAASGTVIVSCAADTGPALTIHKEAQGAKISDLQFHHTTLLPDVERYSTVLVSGAKVSFDGCRFYRAAGHGMAVIQGGDVIVDQCRFEENGWDGISVQDAQSQAQIRNSVFLENIHHGIQIWNHGSAVVENNRCANNCLNGIFIDTSAVVTVKTNQLNGNREYGIFLRSASGGEVERNRIADNLLGGMAIASSAKTVTCQQNVFGKNEGAALILGKGLISSAFSNNQFPDSIEKSVVSDIPME